jgi:hypothetical protein
MKVKRSILSIMLTAILCVSAVIFFGCGTTSESTVATYSEAVTTYKNDTSLFSTGYIYNVSTNYYLNDFSYKENGKSVAGYQQYQALNAMGLNFIEKYYSLLDGISYVGDYSSLNKSVENMNNAYKQMKEEHSKFVTVGSTVTEKIYNGYFARYRVSAITFIDTVYTSANALADFISTNVYTDNDIVGNDAEAVEEEENEETDKEEESGLSASAKYDFYINRHLLKIATDFEKFFLESCKGQNLSSDAYSKTGTLLNSFCTQIMTKTFNLPNSENLALVKVVLNAVNGDRTSVNTALSNFSLYDYSNIDSYIDSNSNMQTYYDRIESYYFGTNSVLNNLKTYLYENI